MLERVAPEDVVVSTTGMISRELFAVCERPANFYMLGSMGLASALGLGLALLEPSRSVVVLEGDGSALMTMGTLALIASESPGNLLHVVLDNEAYESTGAQPSISSDIDLARVAQVVGYRNSARIDNLEGLHTGLSVHERESGLTLLLVKVVIAPVEGLARVPLTPEEIRDRFSAVVREPT